MPGYTKEENSLATGIPNRTVSPETGSFGNATKTNKGDTGEGTNQARPAGLDNEGLTTDDAGEHRSFSPNDARATGLGPSDGDVEPVYQQIADGGDHFDHDKHLGDDKRHKKHD